MEPSNCTWTCCLLNAETMRVFMVLFWLKFPMFNVNHSEFALFAVMLKNQTSNQVKKNPTPTIF